MKNKDWRERFEKLVVGRGTSDGRIPPITMGEVLLNTPNPEGRKILEDFISSEIEKVREELVSDINNTLIESIENNESVSKVIEKIDIKVFDDGGSSTIKIDMVNMVDKEIEKAEERGRKEVLEKLREDFSEYGVPDDVRYAHPLFYINNIIEKRLEDLTSKD